MSSDPRKGTWMPWHSGHNPEYVSSSPTPMPPVLSPREKLFGDIKHEFERMAPLDMDERSLRVLQAAITIRLIELDDKAKISRQHK